jgi:magnesium chelatase subunit D
MTQPTPDYPFAALVDQPQLVRALKLTAIDPRIGGVLIRGEKGTAKSTAARGLAEILPRIRRAENCPFNCEPTAPWGDCPHCAETAPEPATTPVPFVNLPLGATEDRVLGTLDLNRMLQHRETAIQPGLLASAHRGVLYIDETNLLPDHLIDVILDAAASGQNVIQRDGISLAHPARFVLVGTMNPEEGQLRPQLLDRFGLMVDVAASDEPETRARVIRRRLAFDEDPVAFRETWANQQDELRRQIAEACDLLPTVQVDDGILSMITQLCARVGVDGMRADIVLYRTVRALAALDQRRKVAPEDVRAAAELALPHRRRRQPFDPSGLDGEELDQHLDDLQSSQNQQGQGQNPPETEPQHTAAGENQAPHGEQNPSSASTRSNAGDGQQPDPAREAERDPNESGPDTGRDRAETADPAPQAPQAGNAPAEATPSDPPATDEPTEVFAAPSPGSSPRIQVMDDNPAPAAASTGSSSTGRRNPTRQGRAGPVQRAASEPDPDELDAPATVRAAAQRSQEQAGPLDVQRSDLHGIRRQGRAGSLILFLVDASGSMAARRRMEAVKGAVLSLLQDAYQQRDEVAVIAFRATHAEQLLAPTRSVERADQALGELPTGGRTPLAHALALAGQTLDQAQRQHAERYPLLVLLTDGKANVPLPETQGEPFEQSLDQARQLAAAGRPALVLDTDTGFSQTGRADELATALNAHHLPLDELTSEQVLLTLHQHRGSTAPANP